MHAARSTNRCLTCGDSPTRSGDSTTQTTAPCRRQARASSTAVVLAVGHERGDSDSTIPPPKEPVNYDAEGGHVMQDWKTILDMTAKIAQIAAIVVGGVWAYFNFVRRRTFNRRGELNLRLCLVEGTRRLIRVTIVFENTGLAVIRLHPVVKFCRVFALTDKGIATGANVDWGQELILSPAFSEHHWVEGQETISDELLIPVPSHLEGRPAVAYRVAALVTAKPGRLARSAMGWTSISVIAPGAGAAEYEPIAPAH
jgi:hypothetical protein